MTGACSCKSCRRKACGRVSKFEGGQTAGLNALKNRWLGRVAARDAVERHAEGFDGFGGFEGGQTGGLNALKNRWLGRVAARVAVERPAGGFGACSCERVAVERPARGFGGFGGFEGGQAAGLNALKKQMAGACGCESCRGNGCSRVWRV